MKRAAAGLLGLGLGALIGGALFLQPSLQGALGVASWQALEVAFAGACAGVTLSWGVRGRLRGAGWLWVPLATGAAFLGLLLVARAAVDAVERLFPRRSRTVDVLIVTGPATPPEAVLLVAGALGLVWLVGFAFVWLSRDR